MADWKVNPSKNIGGGAKPQSQKAHDIANAPRPPGNAPATSKADENWHSDQYDGGKLVRPKKW